MVAVIGGAAFLIIKPKKSSDDKKPTPQAPKQEITATCTYVSLGDSIAQGYGLSGSADSDGFVAGSYANSFKNLLEDKVDNLNAKNYAIPGYTAANLLSWLNSMDATKQTNVTTADIITISIGANDVLGPAKSNLLSFIKDGTDIRPALDGGIETFKTNFPLLLAKLEELNPNAKLVFFNIFNPYKQYINHTQNLTINVSNFYNINVSSDQINTIGSLTEEYLDAENLVDANGQASKSLNKILEDSIKDKPNCVLLDVKACYDAYYDLNNSYEIIKTNILSQTTVYVSLQNMQAELSNYLDPHPTLSGHQLISSMFNETFIDLLLPEQQNISVSIVLDYDLYLPTKKYYV